MTLQRKALNSKFSSAVFLLEKWHPSRKPNTTGTGGSGQLSELDETVLDILGRESANLEPVKVEDSEIVFEKEVVVCTTPGSEGDAFF